MKNSHNVSYLFAHIVICTKYREKFRELSELCIELERYLKRWHCESIEIKNGDNNHVHLLFEYPPTIQLSKLVNLIKSSSSFYANQVPFWQFPGWSNGYYVASVGKSTEKIVREYIKNQ